MANAQPELRPAYLIAGSDWPKVDAAIARLRAHFPEESVEQFSAGGDQPVDVAGGVQRPRPLRRPPARAGAGTPRRWTTTPSRTSSPTCADPAPDTVLAPLRRWPGSRPKHPLAVAVAAVGDVRALRRARSASRRPSGWCAGSPTWASRARPAVARRLVDLAGDDVGDLALEVEKLAAYCAGAEARVEDVELLVIPRADIKPWDITDAWGRRDAASVIALATADVERPEDVGRLIAQLASHVRKVHRAAVLLDDGGSQADVARDLNLKPFPAGKLVGQARAFARDELGRAVVRLADLDLAVKGGSRLDARFELELALAEITGG